MKLSTSTERSTEYEARLAIFAATAMFGFCNVAWRYGHGNIVLLSFERAALGALLLSQVLWRDMHSGTLRALLHSVDGMLAVCAQGAAGLGAALIFHSLPGPQSAIVVAIIPALLIAPSYYLNGRVRHGGIAWVLLSVSAACAAALSGGLGPVTAIALVIACVFLTTEILTTLTAERARKQFQASTIVAWGLLVGAIGCGLFGLTVRPINAFATSGLVAACIVAAFGTLGRVLRNFSLPFLGASVNYASSQITALIMVIGGIILFDDHLSLLAGVLGIVAAGASVAATLAAKPRTARLPAAIPDQ